MSKKYKHLEQRFDNLEARFDVLKESLECYLIKLKQRIITLKNTDKDLLNYLNLKYEDRSKPAKLIPKRRKS